ncbi:MAG: UDP-N-acetylmuramoyl-L-alanyl-D-glutamate--2,6-diaminopimelate ligase [Ilumatobacteraceae bacterium]
MRSVLDVLADVRGGPALRVVGDTGTATTAEIVDLTVDSRHVRPGWLFCCVRGERADGHDFAAEAVASGASALLVERELPIVVPQILTADSRSATGWIAAAVHGHPSDSLSMVGVTGTNGKTTTSHLIGSVLRAAGRSVEVLGTLSGVHTTPEAPDLQRQLAAWRDAGVDAVAMEVSSHALALDRVAGTRFDVAVFTNLGRDHLDLHGTVERYFAAKARLFEPAMAEMGVVNADDVHGRLLIDSVTIPVIGFSLDDASDVRIDASSHRYRWRGVEVRVGIGGAFNVMNSLAAATTCAAMGVDEATIASALAAAPPVPGRFEPVDAGQPFAVIVDYAHTPDGLREVLLAARRAGGAGRVIVVFGCGGDRDRAKRPEMGATAAELADRVVITSDNPRSEDPMAIVNATAEGVPEDYRTNVVIEPDRRSAIALALHMAVEGDVVVIAGKGHEATQTIGDRVLPFDDRLVARELLEASS